MLWYWLAASFAASAARAGFRRFFVMIIARLRAAITVQKLTLALSCKVNVEKIATATIASAIVKRFLCRRPLTVPGATRLCRSWRVGNTGAGLGAGIDVILDQTADRLKLELTAGQSSWRKSMRALSFSMRHHGQLASCL